MWNVAALTRLGLGLSAALLSGCAQAPHQAGQHLSQVAAGSPDAAPRALTEPAGAAPRAPVHAPERAPDRAAPARGLPDERTLRSRFASDPDAVEPGLQLASFLVVHERHLEALHVLDMVLARHRDHGALLARAGILRDLAQNELARRDLLEVVRERGLTLAAPGTLFELAKVEWLAGYGVEARQTLARLAKIHVDSDFVGTHREEIHEWRARIAAADGRGGGDLRDALALLRAAPRVTARLQMLESLAGESAIERGGDGRAPLRSRAIAIACGDESPALRMRALQLAALNGLQQQPLWRTALRDPDPMVRRAAAHGFPSSRERDAVDGLLDAMAAEQDGATFRAMHAAVARVLHVPRPRCDAGDAAERARVVQAWRTQCEG